MAILFARIMPVVILNCEYALVLRKGGRNHNFRARRWADIERGGMVVSQIACNFCCSAACTCCNSFSCSNTDKLILKSLRYSCHFHPYYGNG